MNQELTFSLLTVSPLGETFHELVRFTAAVKITEDVVLFSGSDVQKSQKLQTFLKSLCNKTLTECFIPVGV